MPLTKPETENFNKDLKLDTAEILNSVMEDKTVSPQYKEALKAALPKNAERSKAGLLRSSSLADVQTIGSIFAINPEYANEAINTLVNRIGRVYISTRLYLNHWSVFKKGFMEYGDKIESVYIGLARAIVYDVEDSENTVFKRYQSETVSVINYLNSQVDYPVTIEEETLRQAFLTYNGLSDLIAGKIQSAYNSAERDEFCAMKYILQRAYIDGIITKKTIPEPNSKENIEVLLTNIKQISNDWLFYSKNYNAFNVMTFTPKDKQYFIQDTMLNAATDVNVLAQTFNVDYARYMGIQKLVDTFGENDNEVLAVIFAKDPNYKPLTQSDYDALLKVHAMLIDEDFIMCVDNLYRLGNILNPKGLYYNNFLHLWKIYGCVPFAQAVAFTTETTSVTSVSVSPATATVAKGETKQFTATVSGTGNPSKLVHFELSGTGDSTISDTGLVTISPEETASSLKVKATSLADETKSGTATITVTGE